MPVIVLDRDGVINVDSDNYIKSADEWHPIDGSIEAIADLTRSGYQVAVATNQSGLGRSLFTLSELDAMHSKMRKRVEAAGGEIAVVSFCPHLPEARCGCRKPEIGLLLAIHEQLPLDSDSTWFVGDTDKDLEAARRMGIRGALVRTGKGRQTEKKGLVSRETTPIFDNLRGFADWLLDI